jgi:predicted DNA-binding protein (MmcQ/YjbR family)
MRISKQKLGMEENDYIDVVNLKHPMENIGFILQENGVYPAYHMNRSHWITVALDGSATEALVKNLLSISFDLTVNKK